MDSFFIDIDGTITDNNPEKKYPEEKLVWNNPVLGVIRDVMVEEGWETEEARKTIEEFANKIIWWDYPDFIAEFNLPVEKTWKRIYDWHDKYKMVYWDTVEMIKKLHKKCENLFIVSNNPITGCLLNLRVADLGNITGSKFFKRILGANILRGQKYQVELWKRAIVQVGVNGEKISVIGDSEKEDGDIPVSAGIRRSFIINRTLEKEVIKKEKKIFLKNPNFLFNFEL